jgi:hypothetical protein
MKANLKSKNKSLKALKNSNVGKSDTFQACLPYSNLTFREQKVWRRTSVW